MIDKQQLQDIGNQVTEQLESKYPSLIIDFSASSVKDEDKTFLEVLIGFKDTSIEKLFQFGIIDHLTAPNTFRIQQVFEKYIDRYARQFLGIE